jgi:hypothetical protein
VFLDIAAFATAVQQRSGQCEQQQQQQQGQWQAPKITAQTASGVVGII